MGILNASSLQSRLRGFDYYKNGKVTKLKKIDDTHYEAEVMGSYNNSYHIKLDIEHNRKCTCNCPYAYGTKIICKHMVATYFTIFPDEASSFYDEYNYFHKSEEKYCNELEYMVEDQLNHMDKEELKETILSYVCESSNIDLKDFADYIGIDYDIYDEDDYYDYDEDE